MSPETGNELQKGLSANTSLNVLLITSISGIGFNIAPPLGLYRLQHYLTEHGILCDILDLDIDSKDVFLQKIENGDYQIIGFSVSHFKMELDLDLLWECKRLIQKSGQECLFLGGGQEATLNYEQWLNGGIDIIITGFAEKSLLEVCRLYQQGKLTKNYVPRSNGVIFRDENGKTIFYPSEALTQAEFEELSFQEFLKIDIPYYRYWDQVRSSESNLNFTTSKFVIENVRLYTTSHCPRGCAFCSSQFFLQESQQQKTPRFMLSADQVHTLILKHIQKYGAKGFLFSDDDFLTGSEAGLKRIYALCEKIIQSKVNGEIPREVIFNCQTRISDFLTMNREGQKIINDHLLDLLSQAGFHSFGLGVETFSERLLHCPSIQKIGVTVDDTTIVLDALLARGLTPQVNIIIGIPETTVDEFIETMKTAVKYILKGCQIAVNYKLYCVPGSPNYYSNQFNTVKSVKKNPFTGENVEITQYIIPNDPRIASMVEHIEQALKEELEITTKGTSWRNSIIPKSVIGITSFIAAAKLVDRSDVGEELYHVINKIIEGEYHV